MLNLLTLEDNKKVTNWISSEKTKPFDANFAPNMTNLANGRVSLTSNNSVLVQRSSSSLYSNFILNLYIIYELSNWPRNNTNNFTPTNCLLDTVKLTGNAGKSKFTYNGQEIAFDGKGRWSYGNDFVHTDNQKHDF